GAPGTGNEGPGAREGRSREPRQGGADAPPRRPADGDGHRAALTFPAAAAVTDGDAPASPFPFVRPGRRGPSTRGAKAVQRHRPPRPASPAASWSGSTGPPTRRRPFAGTTHVTRRVL